VVCLAPRAREDSVRPRRLFGVVVRPLNFAVRLHVTQRDAETASWIRPLVAVWVLDIPAVCLLWFYTALFYIDASNPSREEYLEGAYMAAAWARPAALIIGVTAWRKRTSLRTWHKWLLATPVIATAAALGADLLHTGP
jgi:hypothetical protein